MILTAKLVGSLYRRLRRDPGAVVDIVFFCTQDVSTTVADGTLTLVVGNTLTTYDLTATTLMGLALTLNAIPTIMVSQYPTASRQPMLAAVLLDGTASQAPAGEALTTDLGVALTSDAGVDLGVVTGASMTLSGYSRLSWAFLDTCASELQLAQNAVTAAPAEITLSRADGAWLDFHGTFYDVLRQPGEGDVAYASRIVVETLSPRSNNVALELAITRYTGLPVEVVDVTVYTPAEPTFDGTPDWDGTYQFDPSSYPVFGLFDVLVQAEAVTPAQVAAIELVVGKGRAGGTGLRNVTAVGAA